jgi:hypothetical protein
VVVSPYLNLVNFMSAFSLSFSTTSALIAVYSIQFTATSTFYLNLIHFMSAFSLSFSTISAPVAVYSI